MPLTNSKSPELHLQVVCFTLLTLQKLKLLILKEQKSKKSSKSLLLRTSEYLYFESGGLWWGAFCSVKLICLYH